LWTFVFMPHLVLHGGTLLVGAYACVLDRIAGAVTNSPVVSVVLAPGDAHVKVVRTKVWVLRLRENATFLL
jgi:hypothetical protein